MGMGIDETSKSLRDGDDARSSVLVADGFAHQLLEGLIGEASEVTHELSVSHEVRAQHLGQGKGEKGVTNVFEQFVSEKSGKGCGALRIARGADASLLAAVTADRSSPAWIATRSRP